jgi:hypothetical protein
MARSNERPSKNAAPRPSQSAISDQQKRLAEEDARNRAEEARIKRMLEGAPKKREELAKKQRDEFIKRKTKVVSLDRPVDNRFDAITAARPARGRKIRRERTFSQVLSVVLLITLAVCIYWAFRVMVRPQ